jgi:hypothetical protein
MLEYESLKWQKQNNTIVRKIVLKGIESSDRSQNLILSETKLEIALDIDGDKISEVKLGSYLSL